MEIDQTILRQQYDTLATILYQKAAPTEQQAELLDGLLNVLEDLLEPSAEEDTEAFDRSFPELSNAAAGLMALKAMQDADFGSKIADMIIGPLEK